MKDCKGCKCTGMSDWVMRIVLALVFLTAGYGKLTMGVDGFAAAMNLPVFLGWLVVLGEIGAGLGIIIGGLICKIDPKSWLTRASGAIFCIVMLGAIFLVKWGVFEGGFLAGIDGINVDLALFALGFHYLTSGNACAECTICKK